MRTNEDRSKYNVDHNHGTGRVRGLLCFPCNIRLGKVGKWKFEGDWFEKASQYLKKEFDNG